MAAKPDNSPKESGSSRNTTPKPSFFSFFNKGGTNSTSDVGSARPENSAKSEMTTALSRLPEQKPFDAQLEVINQGNDFPPTPSRDAPRTVRSGERMSSAGSRPSSKAAVTREVSLSSVRKRVDTSEAPNMPFSGAFDPTSALPLSPAEVQGAWGGQPTSTAKTARGTTTARGDNSTLAVRGNETASVRGAASARGDNSTFSEPSNPMTTAVGFLLAPPQEVRVGGDSSVPTNGDAPKKKDDDSESSSSDSDSDDSDDDSDEDRNFLGKGPKDYERGDPPEEPPTQLIMEFLECMMSEDFENALKLCKMILIYDPEHKDAVAFKPLIEEKLELLALSSSESESEDSSDDDDDDDDDEDDDDDDDDDDEEEDEDYDDDGIDTGLAADGITRQTRNSWSPSPASRHSQGASRGNSPAHYGATSPPYGGHAVSQHSPAGRRLSPAGAAGPGGMPDNLLSLAERYAIEEAKAARLSADHGNAAVRPGSPTGQRRRSSGARHSGAANEYLSSEGNNARFAEDHGSPLPSHYSQQRSPVATQRSHNTSHDSSTGTGSPAGSHRSPAGSHRSPAGSHHSPAGSHHSPAGSHHSPAGSHRSPAMHRGSHQENRSGSTGARGGSFPNHSGSAANAERTARRHSRQGGN